MTRTERLAQQLMRPINPTVIIILAIYTVVWGLWLISPFWTVFTQAPLYSAMAHIAGEVVWGTIAVVTGLIISRGALKPSYSNLHWGAFAAWLHWLVIAVFYFMGDWTSTGGITSLTFAVYSAVVWLNIKTNRGLYP